MDFFSFTFFALTTLLFSLFVAAVLKFFVFRFVPLWGLGAMPYAGWVIIVAVAMFALQFAGFPVADYYASFFEWLASQMRKGVFQIV